MIGICVPNALVKDDKIMNEIDKLGLSPENTRKANLLIEMGFFYSGLVDRDLLSECTKQVIDSDCVWGLYFDFNNKCIHTVFEDYQFTYSFLDNVIDETNVNLDDFYKLMDTVESMAKYILSSYQNGSDDQLSLNLAIGE